MVGAGDDDVVKFEAFDAVHGGKADAEAVALLGGVAFDFVVFDAALFEMIGVELNQMVGAYY